MKSNLTSNAYDLVMPVRPLPQHLLAPISEVLSEVLHLRHVRPAINKIETSQVSWPSSKYLGYLSNADLRLLATAKQRKAVLVTDDQKLALAAKFNEVRVLNTPRLIAHLAFKGKLDYNKAEEILMNLKGVYIRKHAVLKALKDLEKWR